MKVIDQKGRLFGLINVVDLLVLLAVVAVIGGIAWKLFAPAVTDAIAPEVGMTTTFRVRGATPFLVSEIEKNHDTLIGAKLVNGNEYIDATIESIEITDYVQQVTTADGRIVDALDSTKKDILIVTKSKVAKDTATPKIGNQDVRVGRTFTLKTQTFETIGNIESVVFDD